MKKLICLISILLMLPIICYSDSIEFPLVFSNEYADLYFAHIEINNAKMNIYFVCENKTEQDLSFRMGRFLVNGWDIIESTTFDGFFRVSANSRKRDCFEFRKAVSSSGITDPGQVKYIDFSLELKPWNGGSAIYQQEDYTHYDLTTTED